MADGASVADALAMHVVLAPLKARTWRSVAYLLAALRKGTSVPLAVLARLWA